MSYKRQMKKRLGKLYSQADFIEQLVKYKNYREKDLKILFRDMYDMLIEDLASGNSVHIFPGVFMEIMEHPGQEVYSFKEQKNVKVEPYPYLRVRLTGKIKEAIFASEYESHDERTFDEED